MNKYPFESKLLSDLTQLYHKFTTDTIEILKSSQIDFSKVEVNEKNSYHSGIEIGSDIKTLSTYIMYEKFLIASVSVGLERWK